MSFLDELFSHAKEVYGTLSHNERIKERSRAYTDSVKQGLLSNFPMLAKDPQEVTAADIIGSGFGAMPLAIKAWHGSPHKFDKFDMSKIGTGEGAQAYGHGLYFAENPGVAKQYAETVQKPDTKNLDPAWIHAAKSFIEYGQDPIDGLKAAYKGISDNDAQLAAKEAIGAFEPSVYETSLQWPDAAREAADPLGPQHFLDFDKGLDEQPHVLKAAKELTDTLPEIYGSVSNITATPQMFEGRDLYQALINDLGQRPNASRDLMLQGIPGIRYLDQGSRGADGGTYNYVVFDDQIPRIVKRNGSFLGLFPEGY